MNTTRTPNARRNPAWATVNGRVTWLLDTRFDGNRSAMAKAIGFSHTVIANVVKGKAPGHRLLDSIATRLGVDHEWLQSGDGQPFVPGVEVDAGRGLPVTNVLLPGPPLAHQPLLTGGWVQLQAVASSPTTYWLELTATQAVVRRPAFGFRRGDRLLMETDPAKFPPESDLRDRLCVVRVGGNLRLATVTHHAASMDDGPARLEAEVPEPGRSPAEGFERVYRHYPDGEVRCHERPLTGPEPRWTEPTLPVIRYADIVSVWLQILQRPTG